MLRLIRNIIVRMCLTFVCRRRPSDVRIPTKSSLDHAAWSLIIIIASVRARARTDNQQAYRLWNYFPISFSSSDDFVFRSSFALFDFIMPNSLQFDYVADFQFRC